MSKQEDVYKYRHYDITIDDYVYSTRYATMRKINQIGGEPVYPGFRLDAKHLIDGWTEKNFDPQAH
jgi:hypothetical protein